MIRRKKAILLKVFAQNDYFSLSAITFLHSLFLFLIGGKANKQNENMKKLNHNLKAWRKASETGAKRNLQV